MLLKTVLFIITISIFSCRSNNKSGIEKDNSVGNNITNAVVMNGMWDQKQATQLVLQLLNNDLDSIKNDYSHEILTFYNIAYADKEAKTAITFSRPKRKFDQGGVDTVNSCHACGGEISFIEFEKQSTGWKIRHTFIRAIKDGQWGEPSSSWQLIKIGHNRFGFVAEGGGTGQGYTELYTRIYSIIDNEFKEVFNVMTGFDDSGAKEVTENSYKSHINTVNEGNNYYDIILITKGIKDKKPFEEKLHYKFDGVAYNIR